MKLSLQLHERAVSLCREHLRIEFALIEVLQEIERCRMYRAFGCASLFKYAVDILGMSESVAYAFILVARKAVVVPELQRTLRAQRSCSKNMKRLSPCEVHGHLNRSLP